ncbi:hypothetical protein HK405_008506 [Cladochytrium tenue]|nr:hypothetical protein HK405_008506 [Cladochytrium tenue]
MAVYTVPWPPWLTSTSTTAVRGGVRAVGGGVQLGAGLVEGADGTGQGDDAAPAAVWARREGCERLAELGGGRRGSWCARVHVEVPDMYGAVIAARRHASGGYLPPPPGTGQGQRGRQAQRRSGQISRPRLASTHRAIPSSGRRDASPKIPAVCHGTA